jgi:DNA-binding LytR/AlgR family response regulator
MEEGKKKKATAPKAPEDGNSPGKRSKENDKLVWQEGSLHKDLVDMTAGMENCPTNPRLCFIIDDNGEVCKKIMGIVGQYLHSPNWVLKGYTRTEKFMPQTIKEKPAIVMMDVELIDVQGRPVKAMQLAQEITKNHTMTQIIFFSSHEENICGVYAAEHIYFIPKGVFSKEIPIAIRKATNNILHFKDNCVFVKNRDLSFPLHYNDIIYIENDGRKVNIYTMNNDVFSSYMSIEELAIQLDSRFIHCHKSYIVNIDRIKYLEKSTFVMVNGVRINISQARGIKAKEKYFSHFHSTNIAYDPNIKQPRSMFTDPDGLGNQDDQGNQDDLGNQGN